MKNGLALTLNFFIIVSTASAELTQQGSRPTAQGTQQDSQSDHNIAKVGGNVTIGITLKEHNEFLKQREAEISQELARANRKDKTTLEKQRLDVKTALRDVKASYEKHIAFLQARIVDLEKLKGDFPGAILKAAKQAWANGDEAKIDDLFRNVEERAEVPIRHAAEAAYQRGLLAEEQIRYQAAYDHFVRAADLVKDISRYPLSAGNVANTLALYDKAIVFYEHALASNLKAFGENHPSVAKTRFNLGSVWDDKGDYDKAIGYYEQALASDLKTFGEDHPRVAKTHNNLGVAWDNKGDYDKAIGYYEQALASDLQTFGEDHPSVARTRYNLGAVWDDKGNYDKAIGYYEQALASDLKTFGEDHLHVATIRHNLGLAWVNKGDYDKAIGYYEQALASKLKIFGEDHPSVAKTRNNLSETRAKK